MQLWLGSGRGVPLSVGGGGHFGMVSVRSSIRDWLRPPGGHGACWRHRWDPSEPKASSRRAATPRRGPTLQPNQGAMERRGREVSRQPPQRGRGVPPTPPPLKGFSILPLSPSPQPGFYNPMQSMTHQGCPSCRGPNCNPNLLEFSREKSRRRIPPPPPPSLSLPPPA